ncbi:hypothetical protein ACHAWX_007688 [Stephanocyclus meneghinianus]
MPHEGEEEPVESEILDAVAAAAEALRADPRDDDGHPDVEHMPMPTPVPPHTAPAQDPPIKGDRRELEADDNDDDRDLHDAMALDALHVPVVLEEEPIRVDDNDPQSMAASIKQLQAQQRQLAQLILTMRDTIHDLVASQAKLQAELDALQDGQRLKIDSPKRPPSAHSKPASLSSASTSRQQHHAALLLETNSLLPPTEHCDTTDEQIDQILHAKQSQHGSWPVHRLKKWIEEADLQKIRLHRTEKHAHVPVRIPRTDKNKEGRLICKLCSGGKCNRNTTWMCSTCEVPLCIDTVDGDGEQTHHVRWHRCVDLREEHFRCNALLRGRREVKKRGLEAGEGMDGQMVGDVGVLGVEGEEESHHGVEKRMRLETEHGTNEEPVKMDMEQNGGHHYDEHHVNDHHHYDDDQHHVNQHHLDEQQHVHEHQVHEHHFDEHRHLANDHQIDEYHVNEQQYVDEHHIHDHRVHVDEHHINGLHAHHQHDNDRINDHHVNDPYVNVDISEDQMNYNHGEAHANMHGEGVVDVEHHIMHVHVDI